MDSFDLLAQAARPDLYRVNAFRVADLPVDAAPRDAARQLERLKMLERLGGDRAASPSAFALRPAPSAEAVREATERLHDPEHRLVDEFFWFWPGRFGDGNNDPALAALARGDATAASEIWRAAADGRGGGAAVHNLAILGHVLALDVEHLVLEQGGELSQEQAARRDSYWAVAYQNWNRLLDDDAFWYAYADHVRSLNEPQLTPTTAKRMRMGLPGMLLRINGALAVRAAEHHSNQEAARHVWLMTRSGFDEGEVDRVLGEAVQPLRERIKLLCRDAASDTDADAARGLDAGRRLLEQSRPTLEALDGLLPQDHALRHDARDEVALRALTCQVLYAQKTIDWGGSLDLLRDAAPVAGSESARARLTEEVTVVEQNAVYAVCWFCQRQLPKEQDSIDVPMYGNVTRTPTFNGYQLRWQQVRVKIPRCPGCKKAHRRREWKTLGFAGLGGVAGVAACAATVAFTGAWIPGLLMVSGGILGGGIWGDRSASGAHSACGIRPVRQKWDYPEVKRWREMGWFVGSRPTG
jgi:hypothetical protein